MPPRLAVAAAVMLGGALRLYPIWFGLPYAQARPDETTALGHAAAILAGDPNPHFFNWPSLTLYLFAGVLRFGSWIQGPLSVPQQFVMARGAVALAGIFTIILIARLARRVAGLQAGALAALFLSVAVLHVRDSHFATVDVVMTMFATAALLLVLEAMDAPTGPGLALAGAAAGMAISTKYSAAPLALTVLFVRPGRPVVRDLFIFGAALGAAFLAFTPFAVLDFPTFHGDVQYERAHLLLGHGVDLGRGWSYHPTRSLPYGLGPTLYVAALAGLVPLWRRHRRAALPIAAFAAATFAALAPGKTVFFRYVLPLVPVACLSAAIAVQAIAGSIASRIPVRRGIVTAGLAAIVIVPSLLTSIRIDRLMARTDTRVLAADWLRPQLRPDDTLCDVGDAIGLDLNGVEFHNWRFDKASATFVNAGDRLPDWLVAYDSPVTHYAAVDPRLRDLTRERYRLVREFRGVGGAIRSVFDPQDAFFVPIFGFRGIENPGPDVLIFRRTDGD